MTSDADNILTNSQSPKRAAGDSGSAEQHSIPDQIAAARFAASKNSLRRSPLGFRRVRLSPGNNADVDCNGSGQ